MVSLLEGKRAAKPGKNAGVTLANWRQNSQKTPQKIQHALDTSLQINMLFVVHLGTEPASIMWTEVRPQEHSPDFGSFGRIRGHSSELEHRQKAHFDTAICLPVGIPARVARRPLRVDSGYTSVHYLYICCVCANRR